MQGIYWTKAARQRLWAAYRALLDSSPVALQESRIATRFGETCVFTCGSAGSPPLLLLHGGNSNSSMWLRNLPEWSHHFRIHAVDIIGDPGFSAAVRLPPHGDHHALWLADVLEALHLERISMVCASFGGWVGLDFATRHPEKIAKLVLLSPAGIVGVSLVATLEISALMLLGARGRRRALLRTLGLSESNLGEEQRQFLAFAGVVQLNSLSRLRVPSPVPDAQLRQLPARTLALLGGKDIFFDAVAVNRRLGSLCPAAAVQIIPDAGHGSYDPTHRVQDFLLGRDPAHRQP